MVWWVQSSAESSSDERTAAVAAIDRCLKSHWRKGYAIKKVLVAIALSHDEFGGAYLHLDQVMHAATLLAKELQIPSWVFDGMDQRQHLFDFNGNGLVDEREASRIYKAWLKQKRVELGGRKEVEVPFQSVEGAGYTVVKELGRGGQGAMYLCTKRSWFTTQNYCIKFYGKDDANAGGLGELLDEYELMVSLSNKHVAKTYEVFQDQTHYYLVNEPYFGGDLTKLAKNAYDAKVRMGEVWWRTIFKQCLEGLDYLHEHGIIHCDLKEPNIMIAGKSYDQPRPVLIDFGLSTGFMGARHGVCGTPGYIPPETYQSGVWYPRGDVFSLGVAFFQLMAGLVPSKNGSVQGALQVPGDMGALSRAAESQPLPWEYFPRNMPGLASLLEVMTERDACRRPRPAQAMTHQWFGSNSDVELPGSSLRRLLSTATGHHKQEEMTTQLGEANTLDDLRVVQSKFQMADTAGRGAVDSRTATKILSEHGVDPGLVKSCTATTNGHFHYEALTEAALVEKEGHTFHFLKDLFGKLDTDKSGFLSIDELKTLIRHGVFDCSATDVEQLLAWMDKDGDGVVSLTEFTQAALEYGRVNKRSQVKGSQSWLPWASEAAPPRAEKASQAPKSTPNRGSVAAAPQQSLAQPADAADYAGWGDGYGDPQAFEVDPMQGYPPGPWRIAVALLGAKNLRGAPFGARCNARCVCSVRGSHPLTFQTDVAMGTTDPTWNFEQEIVGFVPGDALEFTVVDQVSPGQADLIGAATLHWEHFFPVGYSSPLTICSPGVGIQGVLHVQVIVVGEEGRLQEAAPAMPPMPLPISPARGSFWADPAVATPLAPYGPMPVVAAAPAPPSPAMWPQAQLLPASPSAVVVPLADGLVGLPGDAHVTWGRRWLEERRPPAPVPPMVNLPISQPVRAAVPAPVVSNFVPVATPGYGPTPLTSRHSVVVGSFERQMPLIRP